MSGGIEATANVATGALWASAVEPATGALHGVDGRGLCLNCGTRLVGEHCHHCGQGARVHRTLASIVHDLLHGVFNFEGKIWRTLPMLVLHPGALTRRFIAGERVRFVSPLALFLFTVFLMFAVWQAVGPGDLADGVSKGWTGADTQMVQAREQAAASLAGLRASRTVLAAQHKPTAEIDQRIAEAQVTLAALDRVRKAMGEQNVVAHAHSDFGPFNAAIAKVQENPGLVAYKFESALSGYTWVLIFLSTPFVALLFLWKRGFGMYDHAIFVTYSISFMSLLAIAAELMSAIGVSGGWIGGLVTFAPPVHMFAQLRGAYGLRVLSALWRTFALLVFASIVLTLFVLALVMLEIGG